MVHCMHFLPTISKIIKIKIFLKRFTLYSVKISRKCRKLFITSDRIWIDINAATQENSFSTSASESPGLVGTNGDQAETNSANRSLQAGSHFLTKVDLASAHRASTLAPNSSTRIGINPSTNLDFSIITISEYLFTKKPIKSYFLIFFFNLLCIPELPQVS